MISRRQGHRTGTGRTHEDGNGLTICEYLDATDAEAIVAGKDDLLEGVAPVYGGLVEVLHAVHANLRGPRRRQSLHQGVHRRAAGGLGSAEMKEGRFLTGSWPDCASLRVRDTNIHLVSAATMRQTWTYDLPAEKLERYGVEACIVDRRQA